MVTHFLASTFISPPVNQPIEQYIHDYGYHLRKVSGASEHLTIYLTFSGGGTRAGAFAYGVLEELRQTNVVIDGKKRSLLHEIDVISAVSGGSFTAAYYGLFGDRIFDDFEEKFLKRDIQRALFNRIVFNPISWFKLLSPAFNRSDFAASYYDEHIFESKTFGDLAQSKGPMVLINATDMVSGARISFNQEEFDIMCSDLSKFPVSRAVASSSALPVFLTPITIYNYGGSCGYDGLYGLERQKAAQESYHLMNDMVPYLNSDDRKHLHLVDGGVADNLGLRSVLDKTLMLGSFWETLKHYGIENTRKVVFIIVNAETSVSDRWYHSAFPPTGLTLLKAYTTVAITRYNYDSLELLRYSFERWAEAIQKNRCAGKAITAEPDSCGDIDFYLIEVGFDDLADKAQQRYLKNIPTALHLDDEDVDKLRHAARQLLVESVEFQRLLGDLK